MGWMKKIYQGGDNIITVLKAVKPYLWVSGGLLRVPTPLRGGGDMIMASKIVTLYTSLSGVLLWTLGPCRMGGVEIE